MARWEPDSRTRLEEAALTLFAERGYEGTTVAEIAARAGVTERTFFRRFADKREVLFPGSAPLQVAMVGAVVEAPAGDAPIDAVARAVEAACAVLQDRQDRARRRQAVVAATPELRERELAKMATLAAAVAEALRGRGAGPTSASLAAEAGIAVFRVSFERWIDEPEGTDLAGIARDAFAELKAVTAGR